MMRMVLVAAVAALLAMPAGAQAQASASADLTVSVTVIQGLSLTKTSAGDLDFGVHPANTTASVVPASGASFQAAGEAGQPISVSFGTAALGGLVFTPAVNAHDADNAAAASALSSGSSVTLNGSGNYYFWVGGSLPIPAGHGPGAYTGTWTLSVAYSAL
jgi:hypothetical protein